MSQFQLIITTCEDHNEAEALANLLLERKLAACVQLEKIESLYHWQGNLQRAGEVRLMIKSRTELYPELAQTILDNHSYEVPEIVAVPIEQGHTEYLAWVERNTRPVNG